MPPPRTLIVGEHVELWLELPEGDEGAAAHTSSTSPTTITTTSAEPDTGAGTTEQGTTASGTEAAGNVENEWDVRPARVAAIRPEAIVLRAGGWRLPEAPDARAVVRRFDPEGLAEWEGLAGVAGAADVTGGPAAPGDLDLGRHDGASGAGGAGSPPRAGVEATIMVWLPAGAAAGRLYQRRRSPRLPLGLTPIRLVLLAPPGAPPGGASTQHTPTAGAMQALPDDAVPAPEAPDEPDDQDEVDESLLPVTRLTDVSATGAGIVVDCPLRAGTAVTLELELPNEAAPFTIRGRIVEPAVPGHGDIQPQADGLPGYRRGVEFTGTTANREVARLATTLARLLPRYRPQ